MDDEAKADDVTGADAPVVTQPETEAESESRPGPPPTSSAGRTRRREHRAARAARRQAFWERHRALAAMSATTFVGACVGLSQVLPPLAKDVDGVPLLAGVVVGSLAVTAVAVSYNKRRYRLAGVAMLVVAVLVGGWTVAGGQDLRPPERQASAASTSSTTTDDRSSTTTERPTTTEPAAAPPATAHPATTPTTESPPAPAPCSQPGNAGSVVTTRGEDQTHVSEVTYSLDAASDPYITISGRLAGTLPPGHGLFVVKTGNPATHDATPQRNPGSVGFFLREASPESGGCWLYARARLGYECVGGVEFRFYFMLIPDATARALLTQRAAAHPDGVPSQSFLGDPSIENLGHIDVPTQKHPSCPG